MCSDKDEIIRWKQQFFMGKMITTIHRLLSHIVLLSKKTLIRVWFLFTKVYSFEKTIDIILESKKSVVRIGDGELKWIHGISHAYEPYSIEMANELKKILFEKNKNVFLCINPQMILKQTHKSNKTEKNYYNSLIKQHMSMYIKYVPRFRKYGNASITWIYRDYLSFSTDKLTNIYNGLKLVWDKKDVLIVEGSNVKFGLSNKMMDNARKVNRIICPDNNSFNIIEIIYDNIAKICNNYQIVLFALGPTASILVFKLASIESRARFIDIGSLNEDYYCFLRDRCMLPVIDHDKTIEEYNKQIVISLI